MNKKSILIIVCLVLAVIALLVYFTVLKKEKPVVEPFEPKFRKEGTLAFLTPTDDIIKTIDIEVANTDFKRAQGLMWRRSMAENQGMLFLFPNPEFQSFWMKNTYISLDIIYVGADRRIVNIAKNTTPFSEEGVPSEGLAQFVVEVVAGFSDKYGIKAGDKIEYTLLTQ